MSYKLMLFDDTSWGTNSVASTALPQAGEVLSMHAGQETALCGEGSQSLVHHFSSHFRLGLQVDLDKRPAALLCTALLL